MYHTFPGDLYDTKQPTRKIDVFSAFGDINTEPVESVWAQQSCGNGVGQTKAYN